jgi:hypothetical protein
MKHRRVSSFIDDVLANRRPRRFRASVTDAEILRTAITMQAARPGDGAPEPQFVDNLRKELAFQVATASAPPVRAVVSRRSRVLVGVAAAVTVIGGTAAATTGLEHGLAAAPAPKYAYSQFLRMGTFESKDGHTIGEIVAYRGNPSWVLMSIRDPGLTGTVRCQLQMDNGYSGPTGTFVLQRGVGDWARPIPVDIGRIRGATLVSSTGSALATASFTQT